MCGGVSHIDTCDPKDNKHAGKFIDAIGFGDNLAEMKRPVIPCHRTFTRAVAATPFQPGPTPIPNLYPPKTSSMAERGARCNCWSV